MKQLMLIRGVSGSGKSTEAKKRYSEALASNKTVSWFEADDFFVNSNGEYVFNQSLLAEAHARCQKLTRQAMENGVEVILVSNTFTKKWEMEFYLKEGKEQGYDVVIHHCRGNFKNVHNVPDSVVAAQAARFEEI